MEYITNCTNSTAELINAMTETSKEISYRTFEKRVGKNLLADIFPFYTWGKRDGGLKMHNDYAVSYFKGTYAGEPVYYCDHSMIEYIFGGE